MVIMLDVGDTVIIKKDTGLYRNGDSAEVVDTYDNGGVKVRFPDGEHHTYQAHNFEGDY